MWTAKGAGFWPTSISSWSLLLLTLSFFLQYSLACVYYFGWLAGINYISLYCCWLMSLWFEPIDNPGHIPTVCLSPTWVLYDWIITQVIHLVYTESLSPLEHTLGITYPSCWFLLLQSMTESYPFHMFSWHCLFPLLFNHCPSHMALGQYPVSSSAKVWVDSLNSFDAHGKTETYPGPLVNLPFNLP